LSDSLVIPIEHAVALRRVWVPWRGSRKQQRQGPCRGIRRKR